MKIDPSTIQFLKDLSKHNSKEWFAENKDAYQLAKKDFEIYTEGLILKLSKLHPAIGHVQPSDCIFRIFRDVRFSREKTPYKTNFGAFIKAGGKKGPGAGYYFHLEPGGSFAGGGVYAPEADDLFKIRSYIMEHGAEYRKIIEKPAFKKAFPVVGMDPVKTAPRGFDKNHPDIDLIKPKHFVVSTGIADGLLTSDGLAKVLLDHFKILSPLNDFLNRPVLPG